MSTPIAGPLAVTPLYTAPTDQVVYWDDPGQTWRSIAIGGGGGGSGTVTSVTAGTGLSGGTITTSGTIALANTTVTPGTYQGLTINAQGQVTGAVNQNYVTGGPYLPLAGGTLTGNFAVNIGGAALPGSLPAGTAAQFFAGTSTRVVLDGAGTATNLTGRVSGGSPGSPTATPAGLGLLNLAGLGHDGSGYTGTASAIIALQSSENWTPSAHGGQISFSTTAVGTITAPIPRALISQGLMLMTSAGAAPAGGDMGAGAINVAGGYYINGASITTALPYLPLTGGTVTGLTKIDFNSAVAGPAAGGGEMLWLLQADTTLNRLMMDAWGQQSQVNLRRADGTRATPTPLLANETIGGVNFFGYDGSVYQINSSCAIQGRAAENWSASAHGANVTIALTPTGSVSQALAYTFSSQGLTYAPILTVATLPAASANKGMHTHVSDANATTFGSVVAGGGTNYMPVFSDGTNWRIG